MLNKYKQRNRFTDLGIFLVKNKQNICTLPKKENTFKIHTRWYMTPEKLNRIDPQISKKYWKCNQKEGTLYHAWWGCTKAKRYWKMIDDIIAEILGYKLIKLPELGRLQLATL